MTVVIGADGRLGQGLIQAFGTQRLTNLGRADCHDWVHEGAANRVLDKLNAATTPGDSVFVAAGLLDPRLPSDVLEGVNFILPKNVILAGQELGLNVVTFGTVLEGMMARPNPYVRSKERLADYVAHAVSQNASVLHCRMHTLFGLSDPPPFMFLGQLFAAIRTRTPLKMTSGLQLREYQHVFDTAKVVRAIQESGQSGSVSINHGKPVKLRDIVTTIADVVGFHELGEFGALPEPDEENYGVVFDPTPLPAQVSFRQTLPAIAEYAAERIGHGVRK